MNFHTSSLRSPGLHQLADRDPQAFLEHVARPGADAVAADVGVVDRRAEEGDRPGRRGTPGYSTVTSSSWPAVLYGSLVISTSPRPSESGGYSSRIAVAARASELMWPGVPVTACATIRPAPVEHGVGEVAGLADDRAERRPLQRPGLLVDRGDQALPEDLELDRVERPSRCSSSAMSEPSSATSTDQPGRMTAVVSRSSTIAGPVETLADAERVRR